MNDLVALVSTLVCVFFYSAVSENAEDIDLLRNVKRVSKLPDNFTPKIVGGEEAKPHEFPSAVRILYGGLFICTGSILSRDYILTAGHCLAGPRKDPFRPFAFTVVVGEHNIKEQERSEQTVTGIQMIIHEKYSSSKNQIRYDIGILKVSPRIRFNSRVVPSNLPTCKDWKPGPVIYTGWGYDVSGTHFPDTLKKLNGTIESYADCAKMINDIEGNYFFPVSSMCGFSTGEAVCNGDSGGPVFSRDESGTLIQVGINSGYVIAKQEDLCKTGVQVTTITSYYVGWIHRRISDCGNFPFPTQ